MGINRLSAYKWQTSYQNQPYRSDAPVPSRRRPAAAPNDGFLPEGVSSRWQTSYRSVLVPLDGTTHGERALPLAVSIAAQSGATLRLVHVYAPLHSNFYPSPHSEVDRELYQQRVGYLRRVSRQVADAAGITVIPECIRQRDIAKGIAEAAGQGVDLVVAATHGYSWLERVWYGGIVHNLIDQLEPPMLLVREDSLRVSIAPDRWLRRVLVPLDGSAQAEQVLAPAMVLGSLYEADYSLLTVVPRDDLGIPARNAKDTWNEQVAAQVYLNEAVDGMRQRSHRPLVHIAVTDESVAQAIVSRAEASHVDCIAMASRSRRGLQRWFQPSITHRVIQLSQVPILVIRQGAAGDIHGKPVLNEVTADLS